MASEGIVVVGASAGGVEALTELVGGLNPDFPAPIVIVLHIPPDHPSLLPRILSRRSSLPVVTAEEGMELEPGKIYVAPPDRHVLVDHEQKLETPRGPRENNHRPAIDPLLRSAALAYGQKAVGVILTGTRDDGTSGLNAIKACGGIAIVQDPNDAAYPWMPRNAIEHNEIDHIVPLKDLPALLANVVKQKPKPAIVLADVKQLDMENRIAAMTPKTLQEDDRPGTPSAFSCPDCGGVLWEIEEGDLVRYRCRVGHAFSPDSMIGALDDELEYALWSALKTLEESARLAKRLADNEDAKGQPWLVKRFRDRERDARNRAEVIRRFLRDEAASESVAESPEEHKEAK
ncbi:MAG TPA: chemotaxis protein CheB [Thermoanaerobaculia bacterium]|nr:chemotaxis protein CheB [Thermoanaerobaculia bacterium]